MTSASASTRSRRLIPHGPAFWVVALTFLAVMAFSTIPTPIYALYQQRDGFPTVVITVVFAAYAVGVVASLFFLGHLSDVFGRRTLILVSILFELLSAVLFVLFPEVAGLIVARLLSGVGVGTITATATAHLGELARVANPDVGPGRASTVATVVNTGGLALGPLIAGILITVAPEPLVVPYLVFLGLLVVAFVAMLFVPETVTLPNPRPPYRAQRVSVPPESRRRFIAAGAAAFAAFAVFGLFTSIAPSVLSSVLAESSHLLAGAVAFSVFAASALAQVVFGHLALRAQLLLAVVLVPVALIGVAIGVAVPVFWLFVVSGILGGAGVGLLFRCSIAVAASLGAPGRAGETLAGIFLMGYIGLAVPVLAIGVALLFAPIAPVVVVFAAIVLLLAVVGGGAMLRRT